MGNITVKHYLNKRLKPVPVLGVLHYPVYVRVTYGRNNHKIKSEWINHSVSENDFSTSKRIEGLIKYETAIILDILAHENDSANAVLLSGLRLSTSSVSDCFLGYAIDPKEAKRQIVDFIVSKADLSSKIVHPYVNLDFVDAKGWEELAGKGVFETDIKKRVLFYAMLLEFEADNYGNDEGELRVGCFLSYYEWKNNNGRKKFIEYTKKRNLLTEQDTNEIAYEFDKQLIAWSSFDQLV